MTTAADIKRLTTELRERDPRLALVKRMIVIRPCEHWLCGLYFRRYSEKNAFGPTTMVQPLYIPASHAAPWSGREALAPLDRGAPSPSWNATWPNCGKLIADLALEVLLPEVEAFATPERVPAFLDKRSGVPLAFTTTKILTHALAGRLEEAIAMARAYLETEEGAPWIPVKSLERRRRQRLIRIFEAGQERTNQLLRTFERMTARKFGVEQWWRWAPVVAS